jgi:predicted DNA-binding transcriptional regulator AlpA
VVFDTGDLLRRFGCSPATLYRCIYERGLKPNKKIGREMFFTERRVEAWVKKFGVPGRKGKEVRNRDQEGAA